jgi:hypothetical protein
MDKINTVKYDMNRKMKNVDQRLDLFMKLFESTMNNIQLMTTNILQNQERMMERIENIEKDMRILKNRKTTEHIESERTKVHKLIENFHDTNGVQQNSNTNLNTNLNTNFNTNFTTNRYLSKNSNSSHQLMNSHASTSYITSYAQMNPIRNENEDEISLTNSSSYFGTEYDFDENELECDENINKKHVLQKTQSLPSPSVSSSPCPSIIHQHQQQGTIIRIPSGYRDIRVETFLFEDDFVKRCLEMNSISGDIRLFKKMYIENINKEFYPIRHIKKKLQYWLDGHMNDDDTNGSYIKNTITKNISILYLRINQIDRYLNNDDQFIKNQDHIFKLSDDKYKDKIMKEIIKIIHI